MHPSESDLALFAGGELGLWTRFRIARHVRHCGNCSRNAEEFRAVREWMQSHDEMPPEIDWEPLAAELKANIRLGLAAGQCVAPAPPVEHFRWRTAAMAIPILAMVIAGWLLQSWPVPLHPAVASGPVLKADARGIEVRENGRAFALLPPEGADVSYTVSGAGTVRSRYLDAETGYVTISNVYAQ